MNKQRQQQQECFVHVVPSDIKPRFLKNLPHLRVRSHGNVIIWEMAAETKNKQQQQQQPTNKFAMLRKSIPPTL